jgi:formylmethanofuran dehydrogenase subunit C
VSVTQRDSVFPNIPDPVEKAERVVGAAYDLAHLTGLGLTSKAKVDAKSVKADKITCKKLTITGQAANEILELRDARVNGKLIIGAASTDISELTAANYSVVTKDTAGVAGTQTWSARGSQNFNGTAANLNNATVNVNGALNVSRASNLSALNVSGAITQSGAGQVRFTGNVDASSGLDVTGGALTVTNQQITQSGAQVTFGGNVNANNGIDVSGAALTINNQAITQTNGGQVTFAGNVDAASGIDVSGAALTINNQAITQTNGGQVTFAGNVDASSGLDVTGADLTVATNSSVTGNSSVGGALDVSGTSQLRAGPPIVSLTATITTGVAITTAMSGSIIFLNANTNNSLVFLPQATVGLNYKIILSANSPAIGTHASIKAGPTLAATTQGFFGTVTVHTTDGIDATAGNANERESACQIAAIPTNAADSGAEFFNLATDGTLSGGNVGDVIDIICLTAGYWHVNASLTTSGVIAVSGAVDVIDGDGSPN